MGSQTPGAELAVQALDEGVVGWFSRTAEVEHDAAHEGPQIELLLMNSGPLSRRMVFGYPISRHTRWSATTTSTPR
jgi:hypothetical protein